ncbi:MAG: Hpt domain-containing protein [Opitutaceae bacterium]|nr:Hpt domain-containing protein [Opitutaceae bacterium]
MSPIESTAIEALRALNPGDDSFLRDLIQIYLDDAPKRLDEIEQSVKLGDAQLLALAAHSLKGSSANFGARQLRALCEQFEAAGRAAALDGLWPRIPALRDEFNRVKAALEALLPDKGPGPVLPSP